MAPEESDQKCSFFCPFTVPRDYGWTRVKFCMEWTFFSLITVWSRSGFALCRLCVAGAVPTVRRCIPLLRMWILKWIFKFRSMGIHGIALGIRVVVCHSERTKVRCVFCVVFADLWRIHWGRGAKSLKKIEKVDFFMFVGAENLYFRSENPKPMENG